MPLEDKLGFQGVMDIPKNKYYELDLGDFTYEYGVKVYIYPQVDKTKLTFKNLPKDAKIIKCRIDINNFGKKRNEIEKLDISCKHLTGNLDLSGFINLTKLDCSDNKLTNLSFLNTLPHPEKLTKLSVGSNNSLSASLSPLQSCSQLEELDIR
ncbi:6048_t:CDS:2 [Funneliformis geosporum]|nr:6048_t:CDS:2 [Funneliformis geosporum]